MMSKTNEEAKRILFFSFSFYLISLSLDWQTSYLLTGRKGRRFWNWFLCPNSASPVEFVWKSSSLKSRQGILCPSKILEISFNLPRLLPLSPVYSSLCQPFVSFFRLFHPSNTKTDQERYLVSIMYKCVIIFTRKNLFQRRNIFSR